jgi:hypothetical protein
VGPAGKDFYYQVGSDTFRCAQGDRRRDLRAVRSADLDRENSSSALSAVNRPLRSSAYNCFIHPQFILVLCDRNIYVTICMCEEESICILDRI